MEDQEGPLILWRAYRPPRCLGAWFIRDRFFAWLQLIKALEEARGNGTSMISLIMPPKDQVLHLLLLSGRQSKSSLLYTVVSLIVGSIL